MKEASKIRRGDYGPQRLTVELANICNLHCSYCLRDEAALYRERARFFPLPLLTRILREAKEAVGITRISFTGGEPTLHPEFAGVLTAAANQQLTVSFVTNGWNFEKLWPTLLDSRESISHIAFSIDGVTPEEHDRWRGSGSFVRLIKAFARCHKADLPFALKTGIRRDTIDRLENIALFAARMGATTLSFSHLLPTDGAIEDEWALSFEERRLAEQEIAALARIFKMRIAVDVGYYNIDPAAPCSPLAGRSCNVDYRGRLTLCCNLSGFRNAASETDVAADLNSEPFASAYSRLQTIAQQQMLKRSEMIKNYEPDRFAPIYTGSPCLLCLQTFGKIPWRYPVALNETSSGVRMLPVVTASH